MSELAAMFVMGSSVPGPMPLGVPETLVFSAGQIGAEVRVLVASVQAPAVTIRWTLRQAGGGAILGRWDHSPTFEPFQVTVPPHCELRANAQTIAAPGGTALGSVCPVQLPRTQAPL